MIKRKIFFNKNRNQECLDRVDLNLCKIKIPKLVVWYRKIQLKILERAHVLW